ncbi:hypothetical protein ACQP0C_03300 [Nocardia sp. CA-129566]
MTTKAKFEGRARSFDAALKSESAQEFSSYGFSDSSTVSDP